MTRRDDGGHHPPGHTDRTTKLVCSLPISTPPRIAGATLHHAAIFVDNIDRSAAFYTNLLGLTVTDRGHLDDPLIEMLFLSAGLAHHDLVLARRLDGCAVPPIKHELFHLAFELPSHQSFDDFLIRVRQQQVPVITGPLEHPVLATGGGTRRALYLGDPDGYLLEVTQDCPEITTTQPA
jgi:catechol 2,3-dioxygenase-like lactoylglutathione lyase family enzyme